MRGTDRIRTLLTRFTLVAVALLLPWVLLGGRPAAGTAEVNEGLIRLSEHAWAWIARDEASSNGALFVGDEATLVVDPGLRPALAREFLAAARRVGNRPIRWVVLSHWHPDHAMGVTCLAEDGFEIIAHPKTRRALAERGHALRRRIIEDAESDLEREELTSSQLRLPDHVLDQPERFDLGGHSVEVFPVEPAHTQGDLAVWSSEERVLVTGDLFMNGSCPSMGEGSVESWAHSLTELEALEPAHIVPGHFGVASIAELRRFRGYLEAQLAHAADARARGLSREEAMATASFAGYEDYLEFPQYGATFSENAGVVNDQLRSKPAGPGEAKGFIVRKVLNVGRAPHQIAFSAIGDRAYVAAAGSDRVVVVDTASLEIIEELSAPGTPLGIAVLPSGEALAVSAFASDAIGELRLDRIPSDRRVVVGEGSSLFVGPLPGDLYLISTESANKLRVFDATDFSMRAEYPTGHRPFPPGVTSDGRKAFVPDYDDASLTVIDLWNERVLETVSVGEKPSGATVLPGDIEVAVAVRGESRVVFVNTASHRRTQVLSDGIGEGPFSVVLSADGRLAYVNNTASNDLSVLDLHRRSVIARVPVGETPIVMAAQPHSKRLWIGCEGSHELWVVEPPGELLTDHTVPRPQEVAATETGARTQVAVMGMIHDRHRSSLRWGLSQVEAAIRAYAPDVILPEIPPDRWPRIWTEWSERGVIDDPRVKRFPEYTDVLLPLKIELGFAVEPCAAWTKEMSDLRQRRLQQFREEPRFAASYAEYQRRNAAIEAEHAAHPIVEDDPQVIHSTVYDERTQEELRPYDELLDDWLGPGGWTHINRAHYALIEKALERHRGQRVLITFGAGHKYWFLEKLRQREDIELVDLRPMLPGYESH